MAQVLIGAWISVWPSGALRATERAPISPVAPGRFSTTTGLPRACCTGWATARATMSEELPGGNGTTMVTLRDGQSPCAPAGRAARAAGNREHAVRKVRRRMVLAPLWFMGRFGRSPGRRFGGIDAGVLPVPAVGQTG